MQTYLKIVFGLSLVLLLTMPASASTIDFTFTGSFDPNVGGMLYVDGGMYTVDTSKNFVINAAGDDTPTGCLQNGIGVSGCYYVNNNLEAQITLNLFVPDAIDPSQLDSVQETLDILTPTRTFIDNQGLYTGTGSPEVGFSRADINGVDLYRVNVDPALVSTPWDMTTSFGPVGTASDPSAIVTSLVYEWAPPGILGNPVVYTTGGTLDPNCQNASTCSTTLPDFGSGVGDVLDLNQQDSTGTFTATVATSAVPEPNSLILLGLGLSGLIASRSRRRA